VISPLFPAAQIELDIARIASQVGRPPRCPTRRAEWAERARAAAAAELRKAESEVKEAEARTRQRWRRAVPFVARADRKALAEAQARRAAAAAELEIVRARADRLAARVAARREWERAHAAELAELHRLTEMRRQEIARLGAERVEAAGVRPSKAAVIRAGRRAWRDEVLAEIERRAAEVGQAEAVRRVEAARRVEAVRRVVPKRDAGLSL